MSGLMPWVIIGFWLFGFWFLWKIAIPQSQPAAGRLEFLSVIIPARNEEQNIARLLDSLKDQYRGPWEIIVVDDQSDDATAKVADKHGARTIRSRDLPPGWIGKPWACLQGARQAKGSLLLFLDADTVMAPGGLEKLVASLPQVGGVVTVQPYHHMQKLYERLSAVFNIIVMAGSNAFTPLGGRINSMGAFGPCLLCRKEDYFKLGGHEPVRGEILENTVLGRIFLDAGYRVCCYGGKGVLSFRMYGDGMSSMVEGFSKGFVIGARGISWLNLLMIVCWVFGCVTLTRHLIQSAFPGSGVSFAVYLGLYFLFALQFYWMLFRIGNFGAWPALLFPVPVLFFVFIFFLSIFNTAVRQKAHWKGRSVSTRGGRT